MLKKLFLVIFVLVLFLAVLYRLLHDARVMETAEFSTYKTGAVRWKMANTWGTGMPVFEESALRFADNVKKMSGGRFLIRVDSANKHKAPYGVFDLVRSGQYEMGHTASYYWKGKDPATPTLTTTPFGMNAEEQYAWFYFGGGLELQQRVYAKHGLLAFPAGNTGVQMGGWFRKEIKGLEDLKGLKFRIPGLAGDVVARAGAEPVNIPAGELYTALQLGTIDALEWVGPHHDTKMGFQQIAEFYYTGWHEPASELEYLINQEKFRALPDDLREILQIAMRESAYHMWVKGFHENARTWGEMKKKYPDVQVRRFPQDVIDALKGNTEAVLKELSRQSSEAGQIIKSQRQYLKTVREWTSFSEQAYLETR